MAGAHVLSRAGRMVNEVKCSPSQRSLRMVAQNVPTMTDMNTLNHVTQQLTALSTVRVSGRNGVRVMRLVDLPHRSVPSPSTPIHHMEV